MNQQDVCERNQNVRAFSSLGNWLSERSQMRKEQKLQSRRKMEAENAQKRAMVHQTKPAY